jgi:hypothetical protein
MRRGPHACPKCECVSNLVDGAGTWWNLFLRPIRANVQIGIRKEARSIPCENFGRWVSPGPSIHAGGQTMALTAGERPDLAYPRSRSQIAFA